MVNGIIFTHPPTHSRVVLNKLQTKCNFHYSCRDSHHDRECEYVLQARRVVGNLTETSAWIHFNFSGLIAHNG